MSYVSLLRCLYLICVAFFFLLPRTHQNVSIRNINLLILQCIRSFIWLFCCCGWYFWMMMMMMLLLLLLLLLLSLQWANIILLCYVYFSCIYGERKSDISLIFLQQNYAWKVRKIVQKWQPNFYFISLSFSNQMVSWIYIYAILYAHIKIESNRKEIK